MKQARRGRFHPSLFLLLAGLLFLTPSAVAAPPAAPPGDEPSDTALINAYRAGKPPQVDTRAAIVQMLMDVKSGTLSPEAFYQKVSRLEIPPGQELRHTLMEVKKDVGNYLGEAGLKRIFGNLTPAGGSDVEAKILTHRKNVVMETIKQAIGIYAQTHPKFTMYYGEVGGWPTETAEQMKFAGDIDFNFLSGDLKAAMALKKIFDDLIVKRYGRTPEALDIPCTVHGMATAEVYVGKHGQAFAESVTKKLWPINFDPSKGPIGVAPREQSVPFEEALLRMVMEAKMAAYGLDDLATLKWPNQPGISLEMIRHFEHDIVGKNVYTDLESFVKAAKYAERSFDFLAKDLGEDAIKDKLLRKLTSDLTVHKKDPKMQVTLIKEYFEAVGKPLPFDADFSINPDGKSLATIKTNERIIREFWDLCRKTMWESANVKIRKLIDDFGPKIASLDAGDKAGAKAIYDELVKYHEMLEIEDLILRDGNAGVHEHLDAEYQKIIVEFREMVTAFKQKIAKNGLLKYIDPQTGKTYAWVEEMLKGDSEFNIRMAGAAMLALPRNVNSILDFIDDGMMDKLRTGKGGDEYIRILRNGRGYSWGEQADKFLKGTRFEGRFTNTFDAAEANFDEQLKKTTDWFNSNLESKLASRGLKLMQGVNNTFNESVANSRAGQATMTALMIYNLKDELPAYYRHLENGDWEGLATEFFKRRVPFGSAVERGVMGDYYGVAWEVTSTLVPPAALVRVAVSLGEYLAETGLETYFDEELATFIDSLYEGAKFKIVGVEKAGDDIKISRWKLLSVAYSGNTYEFDELIQLEQEGAREMAACLRKPSDQRTECFPMEKIRDGLFEWFRSEDAFREHFKRTDPWIQLIHEMETEPHVGEKLKEYFRYQKYARLEQIKVDFLRKTKEQLEKRRAGEQAALSGNLPKMHDELMTIAEELDIQPQLSATIDEKFGGEITQFFTWMKDYLRGAIRYVRDPDIDVWDVYEELSAFITDNLRAYQKIHTGRADAEKELVNIEDQGLRLLTGPYFLTGKSEDDEESAAKWIEYSKKAKEDMTGKLSKIKAEEQAEPAELDLKEGAYDRDMLQRLVYHDSFREMWVKVNSRMTDLKIPSYLGNNPSWQGVPNKEGVMSDQDRATMRHAFHAQRVKELLEEFREHYRALKKEQDTLGPTLTKLEGLLGAITAIEKQINEANTALANLIKALDKELNALSEAVKKSAAEIDGLDEKLAKEVPDIDAIREDQRLVEERGERLTELRHEIEGDTLSTCEVYNEMEGVTDAQELGRLFGSATSHFADVHKGHAEFQRIQGEINAAKRRVDAESKKTGAAEALIKRYEPSIAGLQGRAEGLRAQLTNIQNAAAAVQGLEAKGAAIVAEATGIVESAKPAAGRQLSKEDQKTFGKMEQVLGQIRGVQGRISKVAGDAAAKKDAVNASFGASENSLKESQSELEGLTQRFAGESHQEQVKQAVAEFQSSVETASVFYDPIATAKKSAGVCMDGIQRAYDKKTSPEAITAALDCSEFPNTRAQWNQRIKDAECVCVAGFEWNSSQTGCEERRDTQQNTNQQGGNQQNANQPNCSQWPGTQPQWNGWTQQYDCVCTGGTQWDQNQGRCVSPQQQQQQPQVDCSGWPNTQPQWDASINQYRCVCVSGMQWDQNQGRCVSPQQQQQQQQPQGVNCSQWPGTQSQWNNYTQQYECVCGSGTQWDPNQGRCVNPQQAANCSQWPGTEPVWNGYYQQWDCSCPNGTSWNTAQGKCAAVTTTQQGGGQADCSMWPGTQAQWDANGNYSCVCPSGTRWNQGMGTCQSASDGSSGGTGAQQGTTNTPPTGGGFGWGTGDGSGSGAGTGAGTGSGAGTGTGSGEGTGGGTPPQQPPQQPPVQPPPPQPPTGGGGPVSHCPPGSIELLGQCSATGQ